MISPGHGSLPACIVHAVYNPASPSHWVMEFIKNSLVFQWTWDVNCEKFVLHGSSSAGFQMSATKHGEKCPSVPPSSPLCRPRYLTDSVHITYSCCQFSRILQQFEILWMHTDQCEDCFQYQSTVHNLQGSYWYFAQPLSWVGTWTFYYGVSIFIF